MFNGALVDVCGQVYDYSASVRNCQKLLINVVPGAGLEPAQCFHRGIFLPTTALAATAIMPVFVVWTFSLPYY
jgi:hypothetical protein